MEKQKIKRFLIGVKEVTLFFLEHPLILALILFISPFLIHDKLVEIFNKNQNITKFNKIIKPVAREPQMNKEIEERQMIGSKYD